MNNLALQIDEEMDHVDEGFKITDDMAAEWALKRIKAENEDSERYINVCKRMIDEYQQKIKEAENKFESSTSYLKSKLMEYFMTVPHKATKTQEIYILPAGKLKLKYPGPEYVRDEDKLLEWVEQNKPDLVKVKKSTDWMTLKKQIVQQGEFICLDGEIIDGVKAVDRPPVFEVEV